MFVKQRHSVRLVCREGNGRELLVHGPGRKRRAFHFTTDQELASFYGEIVRRLERDGWEAAAADFERRSGVDRRAPRSGRERRLKAP